MCTRTFMRSSPVLKRPFTLLVRGTITVSAGEDFGL
jgi:hypothetical protein